MRHLTLNQSLFLALLIALLPIGFISVTQGYINRQYTEDLAEETLTTASLATAAVQREPFSMAERRLEMLSRDSDVRNQTLNCTNRLENALGSQTMIVNLVRSDASGRVGCSVLPVPPSVDFATENWWKIASKTRRFSISKPIIGSISGQEVLIAIQPVFTDTGEFDGMITAGIKLSWMKDSLKRTTLSDATVTAIADESGRIIVTVEPTTLKQVDVSGASAKPDKIVDGSGAQWTYAAAPLYRKQLYVVYAEPQSKLSTYIRNQLRADLLIPILALLLTTVAVWIGVNKLVVNWLHELARLANQFARGDYTGDREKFAGAPVEIASLSDDLHSMAAAISERSRDLETALATTKSMAREVNHRVKNNLQMVMSLIALQSAQITDHEAKIALDQTRARMGALALIHRLLYDRAKDAETGMIDFSIIMPELCAQLVAEGALHGRAVDLHCTADHVVGPVDQAIPLALFIVEAVTNAYRHAFPGDGNGNIWVHLRREEDGARLTIRDDGIGLNDGSVGSMGTLLMDSFARQLNGQLVTKTARDEGVEISLVYDIVLATD